MKIHPHALVVLGCAGLMLGITAYAQSLDSRIYLPNLSDSQPTAIATITSTVTATSDPTETPEPTATPTATPVATLEPPRLVINGSFETGREPWIFIGANRNRGDAHSGQWYASLGSVFSSAIVQGVDVTLERPYLVFYQQRRSLSTSCNVTATVRIDSTTIATYGDFCRDRETTAWARTVIDLRPFAGKRVLLRFSMPQETNTDPDDPNVSSWWIDDVGFVTAP